MPTYTFKASLDAEVKANSFEEASDKLGRMLMDAQDSDILFTGCATSTKEEIKPE